MNLFKPTILSLYDYSGVWSQPYLDAGYNVIRMDIQRDGNDIRLLKKMNTEIYGILAAPPCTVSSRAGAWIKRTDDEIRDFLSMVDVVYRIVSIYKPKFYAIENPPGKITDYLGEPDFKFCPSYFGSDSKKLTYLWGRFNHPKLSWKNYNKCARDKTSRYSGTQKNKRSKTDIYFAIEFFNQNQ
jgi:site-specific DNA-cytosine methylase